MKKTSVCQWLCINIILLLHFYLQNVLNYFNNHIPKSVKIILKVLKLLRKIYIEIVITKRQKLKLEINKLIFINVSSLLRITKTQITIVKILVLLSYCNSSLLIKNLTYF